MGRSEREGTGIVSSVAWHAVEVDHRVGRMGRARIQCWAVGLKFGSVSTERRHNERRDSQFYASLSGKWGYVVSYQISRSYWLDRLSIPH